jgi:hypothetical protein
MYMELELISEPSLEVLELKKCAKILVIWRTKLKPAPQEPTNCFKGVKTRFS